VAAKVDGDRPAQRYGGSAEAIDGAGLWSLVLFFFIDSPMIIISFLLYGATLVLVVSPCDICESIELK
jgi:hypothetical protein